MISTIVDSKDEQNEKLFPKLMADKDGWVFLVTGDASGVCVFIPEAQAEKYASNFIGEDWGGSLPNGLTDFHGTLQLRNE